MDWAAAAGVVGVVLLCIGIIAAAVAQARSKYRSAFEESSSALLRVVRSERDELRHQVNILQESDRAKSKQIEQMQIALDTMSKVVTAKDDIANLAVLVVENHGKIMAEFKVLREQPA